jgi:hypothetical protein
MSMHLFERNFERGALIWDICLSPQVIFEALLERFLNAIRERLHLAFYRHFSPQPLIDVKG